MVRRLKFRMITAISTGWTLAATPRDGRSVSNLNRPRRRGPPRHHTGGTRATTTGTAVVRPPGGTGEAGSLSVLLGRLLSPCLLTVRAPAAGKHQAPPPGWEADFTPSGVPTRHSDLPLTPRGGPAHSLRARRGTPHVPGPRPQPASRPPGTIPAGPHESAGGHPRGNGPSPVAPPAIAAHLLLRSEPAAPQFSAGRPRPSARPQPLRSPDRPREPRRSPRGPSRAATVSPRLQQSLRSTLSATLPAPARLGIRLKSAPPEPSG
ncbi:hypothetical protein NDU88_000807 [Pleurodeles waltl]|uniref:Uncharacterized protein n=1 Tax=Pleurodeles waltl TaxID=8319 RepID=A0AAV7R575_PLEWA|nr:hypothetical protein NDU88_000807 [Pleurodeles waltl]